MNTPAAPLRCVPLPNRWFGPLDAQNSAVILGLLCASAQVGDSTLAEVAAIRESSPTLGDLPRLADCGIVTIEARWHRDDDRDSNRYRVHIHRPIRQQERS